MGGHRAEIGAEGGEVDRYVAGGGAGVDVREHAPVPGAGDHVGGGLHGRDLVIGQLHRHERGFGPGGGQDGGGIEAAQPVDAGHRHPAGALRRLQHDRVLDRRHNDVRLVLCKPAFLTAVVPR